MAKIFISAAQHKPDSTIAESFYKIFKDNKDEPFWAANSIKIGENWADRISEELSSCEYFIVLISKNSLQSDMVTEEVRKVKEIQQKRSSDFPILFPIRINLPYGSDTNYDLAGYLNRIQQRTWENDSDTRVIACEINEVIINNCIPELLSNDEIKISNSWSEITPLPNAPLEYPEGQVHKNSPYYVERSIDKLCIQELKKPGALIRIKAPRQYGKTSLLSRMINHSLRNDYFVVPLSFHFIEHAIINDLEKLLRFICEYSATRLKLKSKMDKYWVEFEALKMRCHLYFEDYILKNLNKPLLLAIDEADRLFSIKNISDDFFSMLRGWHEESKINALWENLKIVLAHSTEAYLAVNNINQSPFYNVGFEAKLPAFTKDEIETLAIKHGLRLTDIEIDCLLDSLSGHPYLIRRTFYEMSNKKISFSSLIDEPHGNGPFGDHLRRYLWILKEDKKLVEAMINILKENYCNDDRTCYLLQAAGLIKGDPPNVEISCSLYKDYLRKHLL